MRCNTDNCIAHMYRPMHIRHPKSELMWAESINKGGKWMSLCARKSKRHLCMRTRCKQDHRAHHHSSAHHVVKIYNAPNNIMLTCMMRHTSASLTIPAMQRVLVCELSTGVSTLCTDQSPSKASLQMMNISVAS